MYTHHVPHPKWLAGVHRVRRLVRLRWHLRSVLAVAGLPVVLAIVTLGPPLPASSAVPAHL